MELMDLPLEIILCIVDCLKDDWASDRRDVAVLARSSAQMHSLLNNSLYEDLDPDWEQRILLRAIADGRVGTIRLVLENARGTDLYFLKPKFGPTFRILENPRYRDAINRLRYASKQYRPFETGFTALHVAALRGQEEVAGLLLNHGADPSLSSLGACSCPPPKTLLSHSQRKIGFVPWVPLHLAICRRHDAVARLLISRGSPLLLDRPSPSRPLPDATWTRGVTALHAAVQYDRRALAEFLIDGGYQTDVDVEDGLGETPLDYAISYGRDECFDMLCRRGANTRAPGDHTQLRMVPMLLDACRARLVGYARRLIRYCLELDSTWTLAGAREALLPACFQPPFKEEGIVLGSDPWLLEDIEWILSANEPKPIALTRMLLAHGADINAIDPATGHTALTAAIQSGHSASVEFLIAAGADLDFRNGAGRTPLLVAITSSYTEEWDEDAEDLPETLLRGGADANRPDSEDNTPLHAACDLQDSLLCYCSVEYLMRHGARADRLDGEGRTPLDRFMVTAYEQGFDPGDIRLVRAEMLGSATATPFALFLSAVRGSLVPKRCDRFQTCYADLVSEFGRHVVPRLFRVVETEHEGRVLTFSPTGTTDASAAVFRERDLMRLVMEGPGSVHAVEFLLDRAFVFAARSAKGDNAVYWAIHYHWSARTLLRITEASGSPNVVCWHTTPPLSPLDVALRVRNPDRCRAYVEELLKCGADVNLRVREVGSRDVPTRMAHRGPDYCLATSGTPMELAMSPWFYRRRADTVVAMLKSPSLAASIMDEQHAAFLRRACRLSAHRWANSRALAALLGLRSSGGGARQREGETASRLLRLFLSSSDRDVPAWRKSRVTRADMSEWGDMLEVLMSHGADWTYRPPPSHDVAEEEEEEEEEEDGCADEDDRTSCRILLDFCTPADAADLTAGDAARSWFLAARGIWTTVVDEDGDVQAVVVGVHPGLPLKGKLGLSD